MIWTASETIYRRWRKTTAITLTALVWLCTLPTLVWAELTVEITKGNDKAVAVAVVPFAWEGTTLLPEDIATIIGNDLRLSGQFKALPSSNFLSFPAKKEDVVFDDWRRIDASYLLVGNVDQVTPNQFMVNYELFDVLSSRSVLRGEVNGNTNQLRSVAHSISDAVYEEITGIPGIFSTRILYVLADRKSSPETNYELVYADMDGHRAIPVLKSKEPILAPGWSPDGSQIAYVSFESGRPAIYVQNLATGQRRVVSSHPGLNSAPAWSPDGKKLAMVLSKDGNPDIYVLDLATNQLDRVVAHFALDNEPAWMPDGKSLIFTSNRGGSAQLYRIDLANREVKRLTFEGRFNARAKVFPDGKSVAFIHKGEGDSSYNVAIQNLETGRVRAISSSPFEDAPDIAPNGRMLIYAAQGADKGVLGIISADGQVSFRLPSDQGDVREPAWSPLLK